MTTKNDPEKPKRVSKRTPSKAKTKNDHVEKPNPNYYQLDKIASENADYNLIIGERGNGKTYAIQKHVLTKFLETGSQCMILRRWVEDVKPSQAQNFWDGNLIAQLGEMSNGRFTSIVYRVGKYIAVSYDDKGKPIIDDANTVGYVWDVSESERLKGQSFPNVNDIIYEEFISLATAGYIPDEITYFLNIVSTIVRDRTTVKIWLLGNTVNPYNPYFDYFGIKGLELKKGEIWTKYDPETGCKIAVEFCSKRRVGSLFGTSAKYFAFGNQNGISDMIISGDWQIPDYPTKPFKPANSLYRMFIKFDEKLMELHIMDEKRNYYVFVRNVNPKTPIPNRCFVLDLTPSTKNNYFVSLMSIPIDRLPPILPELITNQKIWFDDKMTGSYFYNFMAQSTNNKRLGMSFK